MPDIASTPKISSSKLCQEKNSAQVGREVRVDRRKDMQMQRFLTKL
jgi:hypothetical protein